MAPKKITKAPASEVAPAEEVVAAPEVAPAEEVVAAPEVAPAEVVTTTEAPALTSTDKLAALAKVFESLLVTVKETGVKIKQAQKDVLQVAKEVAQLEKDKSRRSKGKAAKAAAAAAAAEGGAAVPRRPSGFATPAILSTDLCEFLGLENDSKMARTEVTRRINQYVKDHNLYDAKDKRIIWPDDKLQKIILAESDKPVTYFNLQTHIKHHFTPVAVPASAV